MCIYDSFPLFSSKKPSLLSLSFLSLLCLLVKVWGLDGKQIPKIKYIFHLFSFFVFLFFFSFLKFDCFFALCFREGSFNFHMSTAFCCVLFILLFQFIFFCTTKFYSRTIDVKIKIKILKKFIRKFLFLEYTSFLSWYKRTFGLCKVMVKQKEGDPN